MSNDGKNQRRYIKEMDLGDMSGVEKAVGQSKEFDSVARANAKNRDQLMASAMRAAKGDQSAAKSLVEAIMSSPGGPELVEKLGRSMKK